MNLIPRDARSPGPGHGSKDDPSDHGGICPLEAARQAAAGEDRADAPVLRPSQISTPTLMGAARPAEGPCVSPPDPYEDLLTGFLGPAVWRHVLGTETARAVRHARPVTVILVELAGLEEFTRRWGAESANAAVLAAARALRSGSRRSDYLARIDVGRFGLVLDQTDEISAINCVERLRDACLAELRGTEDDLRLGFGWASPEPDEALAAATSRAAERLADELGTDPA